MYPLFWTQSYICYKRSEKSFSCRVRPRQKRVQYAYVADSFNIFNTGTVPHKKTRDRRTHLSNMPLNCSLTKNSNGLSILLNHNQLVLKGLESVQCEMYFCVIFIQPSPLDLGFKPPHFSSGSLQWLTFRPGNQERLSSFNHTHEDFFKRKKNKINQ